MRTLRIWTTHIVLSQSTKVKQDDASVGPAETVDERDIAPLGDEASLTLGKPLKRPARGNFLRVGYKESEDKPWRQQRVRKQERGCER